MHLYRIGVFGDAPKDFFRWLSRYGIVKSVSSLDTPKNNPLDILVMYNVVDMSGINMDALAVNLPSIKGVPPINFDHSDIRQDLKTAYFLRRGFLRYANIIPIYLVGDSVSLIPLIFSSIGDEIDNEDVDKMKSVFLHHESKTALKLSYNIHIVDGLGSEGIDIPKGITTPDVTHTKLHLPINIKEIEEIDITSIAMYDVANLGIALATGVLTKGEIKIHEVKTPVVGFTSFDPSDIKNRYHSNLYKVAGPYGEVSSSFLLTILFDRSDRLLGRSGDNGGGDDNGGGNDPAPKPPIDGRGKEKEEAKEKVVVEEEKKLSKSLEELFKTLRNNE